MKPAHCIVGYCMWCSALFYTEWAPPCVCLVGDQEEERHQRGDPADQQAEGDDAEPAGERVGHPQAFAGGERSYGTEDHLRYAHQCEQTTEPRLCLSCSVSAGRGDAVCDRSAGGGSGPSSSSDLDVSSWSSAGYSAPPSVSSGCSPRQTGLPAHRRHSHA